MGFFSKIKNAVTGGEAQVTIQFEPAQPAPGATVAVKVTATSTGGEVKSKGAFVDLRAEEVVRYRVQGERMDRSDTHKTFNHAFPLAPAFELGEGESLEFEGQVTIPAEAQPSYNGTKATHGWKLRGRIDTFGNDPDSGWQPLTVK